jgi:hypothetical protein
MLTLVAGVTLAGCATCPPLSEVPVRGGTDAEQAEVEAELVRLERDLALPVCIDRVRLHKTLSKGYGLYDRATHIIALEHDTALRPVLRHEVCHGVDYQNDVVLGREALFPYPDASPVSDAYEPNEAFAVICAVGPEGLGPMWDSECPEESDMRALHIVREEVWGLDRAAPPPVLTFEPIAYVRYNDVFPERPPIEDAFFARITPDLGGGRLRVYVQGASGLLVQFHVDPWTGAVIDMSGAEPVPPPEPPAVPVNWFDGGYEPVGGVLPDGTGVVTAAHALPSGARIQRTFAVQGDAFLPTDGPCPDDTTQYFTVDGEPWMGQLDGDVVWWGRWRAISEPVPAE